MINHALIKQLDEAASGVNIIDLELDVRIEEGCADLRIIDQTSEVLKEQLHRVCWQISLLLEDYEH